MTLLSFPKLAWIPVLLREGTTPVFNYFPACMRDPACNQGPASIGTSESDPRPVYGVGHLSGVQLLFYRTNITDVLCDNRRTHFRLETAPYCVCSQLGFCPERCRGARNASPDPLAAFKGRGWNEKGRDEVKQERGGLVDFSLCCSKVFGWYLCLCKMFNLLLTNIWCTVLFWMPYQITRLCCWCRYCWYF